MNLSHEELVVLTEALQLFLTHEVKENPAGATPREVRIRLMRMEALNSLLDKVEESAKQWRPRRILPYEHL